MQQLALFIRKEFIHVLRDRRTLLILFGMPVMQILIFGFALSNEVKNARLVVVDHGRDLATAALIARLDASRYFEVEQVALSPPALEATFRRGEVKVAVVFPARFYEQWQHGRDVAVQVIADASDPNTATTLTQYVSAIVYDHATEQREAQALPYGLRVETRMLYNPQLEGAPNYVPGVMALVLMLVCVMMTAVSIVREKETGTLEVLLVSPFRPVLVIVAKAVPYLILSLVNVGTILVLSTTVLHVPVQGNVLLLLAESILFITTCLALGIFISVQTSSQQVAMLISLMGMLLPTILFSGFMFPIENMPVPLQVIAHAVPAKWYYIIVKAIMIKGLGIAAVWKETLVLAGMTAGWLFISVKRFNIRLA
ncbi:ABC transporter permease [Dawidia soli]|uniref:ABC transporter permease n=1 Tax=Dawidia soli TaxID=2782352 RepID=A0AAP2DC42_9BACT|nr:ABC transporter permease [Dawidia soli]MBT1689264.1 ABC transporter permease [Dawidia soli]